MLPGLGAGFFESGIARAYTTNTLDAQPWAELGSPAAAVNALITVAPGVTVGATDVTGPAMLIDFYNGSTVNIIIGGKIGAAGGKGGDGDRGRQEPPPAVTPFCGGGGGGGAGANPGAGGARAVEADPDNDSTDGTAGTATTGGIAGVNHTIANVPVSTWVPGSQANRIAINPAILIWPAFGHIIGVNIWCTGSLFAGGNGGVGGFQDAELPSGANDPEDGEDLPAYYDASLGGLTDHPVIWYHPSRVVLHIYEGGVYPTVRGRLVASSSLPA